MKNKTALLIVALFTVANSAFAQQSNDRANDAINPITINKTNKAGLLDGSCGNDEWDVATKIEMPGQAAIYLMHDEDYFYFCASGKAEDHTVLDLYIESAETSRTHKYHLSAQMGESILTNEGWKPASGKWKLKDYAGFWVPYSGLEDVENRKGPIFEKGTHRQMQISRKKFEGNTWNMMIGLSAVSHEGEGPLNYPQYAKRDDKSTWAKFSFSENQMSKDDHSKSKESLYFGQKPPGLIPKVFAPEIVRNAHGVSISPDLDEIYFSASKKDEEASIYFSELKGNDWTPIKRANFTNGVKKEELYPFVSLIDERIYFTAFDSIFSDEKIWYVNRLEDSWSDAKQLDSPINNDIAFYINQSKNGDLFYTSISNGKMYRALNQNGAFPEVQEVELEFGHHGFISPSQEYLLVYDRNKENEERDDFDIYVCFKQNDQTWTKPINLGDGVNTNANEGVPSITPDGKYLFFGRSEEGEDGNIYWVSTEVIHKLKPADLSTREHSYFGQKPPGLIPKVFAPGIVSINGRFEGAISFSADLEEMYFGASNKNDETQIYFSKLQDKQWTPIKRADFTNGKKKEELHPFISPNGKTIYFTALDSAFSDEKIWYVNRLEDSWTEAILLESPINDDLVFYPNQARNGDLYYFNLSKFKMYSAPNRNGEYPKTREMGIEFGHHGFISPSQDYLLVTDRNKEEGRKDNDVYVYFKRQDGTWTKPITLGNTINTNFNEKSPSITPDGKYLFFGRDERDIEPGLSNIYWVDAQIIEDLRPKTN